MEDMNACFERNKEACVLVDGYPAIAVSANRAIAPNIGRVPKSYIKYDPFMNAYIFSFATLLYPVLQNEERALQKNAWISPIGANGQIEIGQFVALGNGLGDFDKVSVKAPKGTVITGGCCDMYGIGIGDKRFIGNRYLERVVAYDLVYDGDIDATFVWHNGEALVENVDPFSKTSLQMVIKLPI